MEQKFRKKPEGHQLLLFSHICGIFTQYGNICPEALPLFFASCFLKQAPEVLLAVELVHQPDIMVYGRILVFSYDFLTRCQGRIFFGPRCSRLRLLNRDLRQIGINAQIYHVVLKVLKLVVYPAITVLLGFVHIVQFVENHLKCIVQSVKVHYFGTLAVSAAFHSEISIDEQ